MPVKSANCHRVFSTAVADAANYILQGVLVSPGTAAGRGIGVPAAGKTGTSDGGFYAAFGGYTPRPAGYLSGVNPIHPPPGGAMPGYPAPRFLGGGRGPCLPAHVVGALGPR